LGAILRGPLLSIEKEGKKDRGTWSRGIPTNILNVCGQVHELRESE